MLFLIGIRKSANISTREKLNILNEDKERITRTLLEEFSEAVLLNTCNRCEVYVNSTYDAEYVLHKVMEILNWNIDSEYIFIKSHEECIRHLFEVSCGLHSKIKGEDQILGQIRDSYKESMNLGLTRGILSRMFENAINCGKTFRSKSKLYEIPVSIISIAVNKIIMYNCSSVMVIGYGKMGKLAVKYLVQNGIKNIIIAVRNINSVNNIDNNKITVIDIQNKNEYINNVDAVISCTSSSDIIIAKDDITEEGKDILLLDIALPRDISEEVASIDRVEVYNVDEISRIDDNNKKIRDNKMKSYRYVIDDCVKEYLDWLKIREVAPIIEDITNNVYDINNRRIKTYHNKGNKEGLVETLIESTSNVYINRAIELLKEETLKGSEEECLRIIQRIFKAEDRR